MDPRLRLLLPRPRRIVDALPGCNLPSALRLFLADVVPLHGGARRFQARAGELGLSVELTTATPRTAHVRLAIDPTVFDTAGAYQLLTKPDGVEIRAADSAGAWYALCTLEQLLRVCAPPEAGGIWHLPGVAIDDAPDFAVRGLMVDVSRTKVPTLDTLFELVDRCAHLKLNQLQLYTEHAFAYVGHERVWRDASPITADDILALDAYCRERHIELVPNQQSFGHMHRWLKHEPYRKLAEVPAGVEHAFSREREPYGLCPLDPGSLTLIEDLYDQLLPHFTSRQLNVGLDETMDLGLGRSKEACAQRGTERVYLDFLRAVHARVSARGRRMQFWGDIIVKRPELVRELPRDAIALEWGYEADHPFAEHAHLFAESGLEFYVCPGTSSWQSIAGRTRNALANLANAAEHGTRAGARGYLVTDWGDRGHLQPLCVSYLGIAAAAAAAWNAASSATLECDWPAHLDAHMFRDAAHVMGRAACELGDAYLETGSKNTNGSALFFLLAFADEPLPHARMPDLSISGLARTLEYVVERRAALEDARPQQPEGALVVSEMRWAADLMTFACRLGIARLNTASGAPPAAIAGVERQRLARELEPLMSEHRRLWLLRNRVGGLDESAGWLERIARLLLARG